MPFTFAEKKYVYFEWNGFEYRTALDASTVEGKDGASWHFTHSMRVLVAAREAVRQNNLVAKYGENGAANLERARNARKKAGQ